MSSLIFKPYFTANSTIGYLTNVFRHNQAEYGRLYPAAGVIARIRTVPPIRLGVATLNYTTPSPKPYLRFTHLQFSSRFILDV